MSEQIGTTYRILEKIGAGGGGEVFLAEHLRLRKQVVLKADKRRTTSREELLRREVDVLKELRHPNIPQVYDYFIEGDRAYTVMEYVAGESLNRPLRRGETFSQPQVIRWAAQLLRALEYLHAPTHGPLRRGYVHGDIKPANIMKRPNGDVCLIDFNIALAIGEENIIGRSPGYASPEHYGLDYSDVGSDRSSFDTASGTAQTEAATEAASGTPTPPEAPRSESSSEKRYVVPDARSDIYSLGATLYHLLSGRRPESDALAVEPLSEKAFSPLLVQIISKAMEPNPNLRWQTAGEMLDALVSLHDRDPRMVAHKRRARAGTLALCAALALGAGLSFFALRRMQTTERWLKLAEYSREAMEQGDVPQAVDYALQALPERRGPLSPPYTAEAQRALTDALGVYALDEIFRDYGAVRLRSAPLLVALSPDGATAACLCGAQLAVIDTDSMDTLAELDAEASALSKAVFLDDRTLLYAGADGVTAYDVPDGKTLWQGGPATGLALSADGSTLAAVCRDETSAAVYDARTGALRDTVSFGGRHQSVAVNDRYTDPEDDVFALNADGTMLAASFSDGSLELFDLQDADGGARLVETGSGHSHFEGGFSGTYFAYSADGGSAPYFAVFDTAAQAETGRFDTGDSFGVQADETGICVRTGSLLVQVDPETGEQTPLITTEAPVRRFARCGDATLVVTDETNGRVQLFGASAQLLAERETGQTTDFAAMADGVIAFGSRNEPVLRLLRRETHADSRVLRYDAAYAHDEARISADGRTVMLFSIHGFRIYDLSGSVICEKELHDPEQMYDQQYVRDGGASRLEVTYYDGSVDVYDAADGTLLSTQRREAPDKSLDETLTTEHYRVDSPLHGTPTVYDRASGREIGKLDADAFLTYVTETDGYLVAQFDRTDGYDYAYLMNDRLEILAYLPYLSDVYDGKLYFDYPSGSFCVSEIYDVETLIEIAKKEAAQR